MKKYILMTVAALMMASCVDTLIMPDDKTVDEDFWKSKRDVQLMVNGAYQAMLGENIISRLIVWGDLRSEEVIPEATLTGSLHEDLTEINLGNTQTDNEFAKWAPFYAVINRCNLVLERAEAVLEEDPSYTQGDYLADCSQMLALRSFCYFYLVRNFRDVPYISHAYTDSSQDRNVAQSNPDSVLTCCLKDLEVAEKNAISANAYTDWRRVGYFTRDAINALQADIYLWLGSIRHSNFDYEQCVAYCDKIIESKKGQHVLDRGTAESRDYWLAEGRTAYVRQYVNKNAEESIFELQFDGSSNTNVGLTKYFSHNTDRSGAVPYLYASSIFGNPINSSYVFYSGQGSTDYRALNATYFNDPKTVGDFEALGIRKYVSNIGKTQVAGTEAIPDYNSTLNRNYIIYRLSDIMLMKAEALTALAEDVNDERLAEAFELVKVVNQRSKDLLTDALKWGSIETAADPVVAMETLVLAERLRELAFEGKRWYDLLRYSFRHTEGIDYTKTMADQNDRGTAFAATYNEMLTLMIRKLGGTKGSAVAAKMSTEPKLYMPVPLDEVSVCPLLRQNPGYSDNEKFNKNY